jgi:flagellar biogenesis protein FliO
VIRAESLAMAVYGEEKGTNPMEKTLFALLALVFVAAWIIGVIWMIKRFRNTWELVKSGQFKISQGQVPADLGRTKVGPGQAAAPASSRMTPEQPRTNALGIVTETLEESLAKHRKQVEQELAQLMKRQSQSK